MIYELKVELINRQKAFKYSFWVLVLITTGLTVFNYINYLGMLESMNEVVFTIDSVTHSLDDSKVEFTISFTITNPTSYKSLDFSSLQSQIYLLDQDGEEHFLGATGYAPPVDIPLNPDESRNYSTLLSVSNGDLMSGSDVLPVISLRFRNVVHYQTPLRRYYQSIYTDIDSHVG